MFRTFAQQLLRDAKASWRKTALLAVLFAVGMCFWVPLLVKALSGSSARPARPTARIPVATAVPAAPASPPVPSSSGAAVASAIIPPASPWRELVRAADSDPLLEPAAPSDVARDPFHLDRGQFSPPVLFAAEPAPVERNAMESKPPPPSPPKPPQLTSTVIGPRQRAALIDGRVYREGAGVLVGGDRWQLSAVLPRRVVLERDGRRMELTIPVNSLTDQ